MKTFQDGDPLFGVMMNAIANMWPNGTAVLSGCTQTGSGAARQITVAAGTVVIGGTVRPVSQQTKTLDAAAFDRYDLISVNTAGTVVVTKGTEERRVPALPANSVPIAVCLIETGQTTLPADRIYDSRMDALRLSVLNIDADKNWNGKKITNVGRLSSSAARYLLSAAPASAAYRIAHKSASHYTGSGGTLSWYDFGPSYTIPTDAGPRGTVLLVVVRGGGTDSHLRVTKNGEVVPEGVLDVEPGDIFQAQYKYVVEQSYTITWSLYAFEAPLFPPGTTE